MTLLNPILKKKVSPAPELTMVSYQWAWNGVTLLVPVIGLNYQRGQLHHSDSGKCRPSQWEMTYFMIKVNGKPNT